MTILIAYPPDLPVWIAKAAVEEARTQLPTARLPELRKRADLIADAIFDRLHTPDIAIH